MAARSNNEAPIKGSGESPWGRGRDALAFRAVDLVGVPIVLPKEAHLEHQ